MCFQLGSGAVRNSIGTTGYFSSSGDQLLLNFFDKIGGGWIDVANESEVSNQFVNIADGVNRFAIFGGFFTGKIGGLAEITRVRMGHVIKNETIKYFLHCLL